MEKNRFLVLLIVFSLLLDNLLEVPKGNQFNYNHILSQVNATLVSKTYCMNDKKKDYATS